MCMVICSDSLVRMVNNENSIGKGLDVGNGGQKELYARAAIIFMRKT